MTLIKDINLENDLTYHIFTDGSWFYIADEDGTVLADEDSLEDIEKLFKNLL